MAIYRQTAPPTLSDLHRDFGFWVQNVRTMRGYKQTELADRLVLSRKLYQNDISMIERGVKPVDFEILVALFRALEVSPREFNDWISMLVQYL